MYRSAKIFRILVSSAIILTTMMTSVRAESIWNHNGSTMMLNVDATLVELAYLQPRSVMAAQGVERGTVLFSGPSKPWRRTRRLGLLRYCVIFSRRAVASMLFPSKEMTCGSLSPRSC